MTSSQVIEIPPWWRVSVRLTACWPIDDTHTLELEPAGRTDDNRIRWGYRLACDGQTIFEARDVCSPVGEPLSADAHVKAAKAILTFLITPSEDPEDLTPEQVAWREEHAEELALLIRDDMCGYCGSPAHISPACTDR
ncbi:hypothetical protein [Actinomadura oligospora]|uniref:hypothetical protein n=1 Tax=Actinomadura oligospora TaxID=111804 RepID=UPI00047E928E|nr:hypothetical protein [Actinomadura oligospora]